MIKRFGPELAIASVILMWASTYPITKQAFEEIQPLAFTAVRFGIIIVLSWVVLLINGRDDLNRYVGVARVDLPRMVLAGLLGYAIYQLGFTLGLANTSPFSASLMVAMFPVVSMIIVWMMGERQRLVVWIGTALSVLGVAVFLLNGDSDSRLLGNLLAFGGAVSFALYQVIGRPLVRRYPAETYACYTTMFGGIVLVLAGLPQMLSQDWGAVSGRSWLVLVYMAVFPAYLAYMLWAWAIRERSVNITIWSLLTPILSGVLAAIMTGEVFGPIKILGAALALGGLLFIRLQDVFSKRRAVSAS